MGLLILVTSIFEPYNLISTSLKYKREFIWSKIVSTISEYVVSILLLGSLCKSDWNCCFEKRKFKTSIILEFSIA